MSTEEKKGTDLTKKATEVVGKIIRPVMKGLNIILPYVITYSQKAYDLYLKLPHDNVQFLIGCFFCFLGGLYPTLFAAIEAAKHSGFETFTGAVFDILDETQKILVASKKDDEIDDDGDGVKDVDQIEPQVLLARKANLILTKMNPAKLDKALKALYAVWLSVAAVLKVQFAKTIALSLTISEFLDKFTGRYLQEPIYQLVPDKYDKWVPIILGWITKSVSISIAWTIQSIISAFTSAMRGGLIMSRQLMIIGRQKDWSFIPEDHKETDLDEYLSYIFAFAGFYFQWKLGFSMPFPLNLLLFPFELAEYSIRWSVTD